MYKKLKKGLWLAKFFENGKIEKCNISGQARASIKRSLETKVKLMRLKEKLDSDLD